MEKKTIVLDLSQAIEVMEALSNVWRRQIINICLTQPPYIFNIMQLQGILNLSYTKSLYHVAKLTHAGLLNSMKKNNKAGRLVSIGKKEFLQRVSDAFQNSFNGCMEINLTTGEGAGMPDYKIVSRAPDHQ